MRVQVFYLLLMGVISLLEIGNAMINIFDFGFVTKFYFCLSIVFRAFITCILILQFTQLSQNIVVKTHYGLNGEVYICGCRNSTIEVFSVILQA